MRNRFYLSILLATTVAILIGCSGKPDPTKEQARQDSIRVADSIVAEEKAQAVAEQVRLDSIRQDSIEMREKAIAAIPRFSDYLENAGWEKVSFFKNRGFDVKVKKEWYGGDIDWEYKKIGTYKPVVGIECNFIETPLSLSVTINGDSDLLTEFYSDAKAYVAREKKKGEMFDVEYLEVNKKGNTVTIDWPGP